MTNTKALVTAGFGHMAPFLELSLPTFRSFGDRHDYTMIVGDGRTAHGRPGAWAKIPLLQEALKSYEHVLWIDADAIFLHYDRDIISDMPHASFQGLVQHRTPEGCVPNTGVWLLRAGATATAFLASVWRQRHYIDHKYWENAAVSDLLGFELEPVRLVRESEYFHGTTWLPKQWNSIVPDPADDPTVFHPAGELPFERRLALLASKLS